MSHHHYLTPFLGLVVSKLVSGSRRERLRNADSGLPPQSGAVLHHNSRVMETKKASELPPAYVDLELGGPPPQPPQPPPPVHMIPAMTDPPDNYMVHSILTTIFCCWQVGICAIVKSGEVDKAILRGDRPRAVQASDRTRSLAGAAFGVGLLIFLFYAIILVLILRGESEDLND